MEESRNSQSYSANLIQRTEDVFVFANTADFIKKWDYNTLNYGVDLPQHCSFGATEGYGTRYADGGSDMTTISVYSQYKTPLSKRINFSTGVRYSNILLNAEFNESNTLGLPFNTIQLNNDAFTASLGLKWDMNKGWESTFYPQLQKSKR